jgi:hypothetical protein
MNWAAAKFRGAMRQRPDFHRAVYNLGTVYYAHASTLGQQQQQQQQSGVEDRNDGAEGGVEAMFQMAAQYVCLAFALEPYKEVYQRSYAVVARQLPLPYLRAGYLLKMAPRSSSNIQVPLPPTTFLSPPLSLPIYSFMNVQSFLCLIIHPFPPFLSFASSMP